MCVSGCCVANAGCFEQGAQLVRDMGYAARFIAAEKIEADKEGQLYDLVVESDGDIEKAFGLLDAFIYGGE